VVFFYGKEVRGENNQMQQFSELLLAAGWTAATQLFSFLKRNENAIEPRHPWGRGAAEPRHPPGGAFWP